MNRISTYLSLALVAGLSSSTALPRAETDMDAPSGVAEVQSAVPASQQQQNRMMSPYPQQRYPAAYSQRPSWNNWGMRPQQPLPYPMQPQTNSPFISGYNPGAESGFMSIPWAPQQPQPIQPAMGGRMLGGPANSRQFQQDSPYGNLSPDSSSVREISSPQPQQQPQQQTLQQQQPWATNTIYSNWAPQQQQPTWNRPSYMPQQPQPQAQPSAVQEVQQMTQWMPANQWRRSYTPLPGKSGCFNRCRPSTCGMSNNWGNNNNNWWVNNNNNNVVGGGNDNVDDDDDDEGVVVGGGNSNVNNIGGGGSWTGGNWNTGFAPSMPSSPCQSSCRTRCNIRPSCGRNPTGFMGNTMVCGRKQAFSGWGNQWGGNSNWGMMNQWQQQPQTWGYQQPQQMQQQTMAAASAQTAQAATSAPASDDEEEST